MLHIVHQRERHAEWHLVDIRPSAVSNHQRLFLDREQNGTNSANCVCESALQLLYCGGFNASDVERTSISDCVSFTDQHWSVAVSLIQPLQGSACAAFGSAGLICGGENKASSTSKANLHSVTFTCRRRVPFPNVTDSVAHDGMITIRFPLAVISTVL